LFRTTIRAILKKEARLSSEKWVLQEAHSLTFQKTAFFNCVIVSVLACVTKHFNEYLPLTPFGLSLVAGVNVIAVISRVVQ
jgi:hypothetical protein